MPGTFSLLVYLLYSFVEPVTQNKWRTVVRSKTLPGSSEVRFVLGELGAIYFN